MINQQVLAGKWNEVKGQLKEKWGKLSDDDVRSFNGNVDQLVGRIQTKTGESREAIERFLGEVAEEGSSMAATARDQIERRAGDVAEAARHGYSEAERVVQQRPGQAVAVAFGLGLLTGLGVALMLRSQPHQTLVSRGRANTEQFGRHVLEALSEWMPESLAKAARRN